MSGFSNLSLVNPSTPASEDTSASVTLLYLEYGDFSNPFPQKTLLGASRKRSMLLGYFHMEDFNISLRPLLSLEVFPEITSPRCPVIGRGRTTRAPAPAAAVQMPTSGTLQPQSPRSRRRGSLLLPSRRKTPNFPAKRLLSYPRVLKGNICLQGRAHAPAGGLRSHRWLCWFNSSGRPSEILLHPMWLNLKELSFCMWYRSRLPTPVDSALLSKVRSECLQQS